MPEMVYLQYQIRTKTMEKNRKLLIEKVLNTVFEENFGMIVSPRELGLGRRFRDVGLSSGVIPMATSRVLKNRGYMTEHDTGGSVKYQFEDEKVLEDTGFLADLVIKEIRELEAGYAKGQKSQKVKPTYVDSSEAEKVNIKIVGRDMLTEKVAKPPVFKSFERFKLGDKCYVLHENKIKEAIVAKLESQDLTFTKITISVWLSKTDTDQRIDDLLPDSVFHSAASLADAMVKTIITL